MQLEQQESFEIKGPQLEVFGEAETRLPAAAKKRPAALAVLTVAIVASVLGIGGAQLKGQWRETGEIYTSQFESGRCRRQPHPHCICRSGYRRCGPAGRPDCAG